MSMIIDGTNGLTFNNATTQNSGGKVLQVVSTTVNGAQGTTTSTSFVATNLSLAITPLFSTSKIFIQLNSPAYTNTTNTGYFSIYRGTTNLGGTFGFGGLSTNNNYGFINMATLDSPATTSSTTYYIYFRTSANTVGLSDGSLNATLTLMEIAA